MCRHVTATLHPGLYRACYVSLTTGNVLDMYKSIAWELGLPTERSRATAYRAIRTEITRLVCEAKQLPLLVIDEAPHLRNDVLEDLRLLCNFTMDSENRLCLLLVGLTELRRRLAMAVHESLSQRLVVRHHLPGLHRDKLDAYLTHRLRLAGCELPLFEPPAVEALFNSARGLPRLINRIAHYALTAAALNHARTVTAEHLEHAVGELRLWDWRSEDRRRPACRRSPERRLTAIRMRRRSLTGMRGECIQRRGRVRDPLNEAAGRNRSRSRALARGRRRPRRAPPWSEYEPWTSGRPDVPSGGQLTEAHGSRGLRCAGDAHGVWGYDEAYNAPVRTARMGAARGRVA